MLTEDRGCFEEATLPSPHVALQRVAVRMLFDHEFVAEVYSDPGSAVRGLGVPDALLRQLQPNAVDRDRVMLITRALADVAPEGHRPTIARCKAILDLGDTDSLGLACAKTMLALGDRSGFIRLEKRLTTPIRRPRTPDPPRR